jgi:hypothetical protein
MEVQYLHRSSTTGRVLVLSVLLQVGLVAGGNNFMSQFWDSMPQVSDTLQQHKYIFGPYSRQAKDALPEDKTFFVINGSLSTPPCSTGVIWIVFKERALISYGQRDQFRKSLASAQGNVLRYNALTPKGVTIPWDTTIGTNNRDLQRVDSQFMLVQMAPRPVEPSPTKAPLVDTPQESAESHGFVWVTTSALSSIVLCGLCISVVMYCGRMGDMNSPRRHNPCLKPRSRGQELEIERVNSEALPLTKHEAPTDGTPGSANSNGWHNMANGHAPRDRANMAPASYQPQPQQLQQAAGMPMQQGFRGQHSMSHTPSFAGQPPVMHSFSGAGTPVMHAHTAGAQSGRMVRP